MKKPTNKELEITHEVLVWYLAYLQENAPYAISEIRALEEADQSLPVDVDELGKDKNA